MGHTDQALRRTKKVAISPKAIAGTKANQTAETATRPGVTRGATVKDTKVMTKSTDAMKATSTTKAITSKDGKITKDGKTTKSSTHGGA